MLVDSFYLDNLEVGHRLYSNVEADLAEIIDVGTQLFAIQSRADAQDAVCFADYEAAARVIQQPEPHRPQRVDAVLVQSGVGHDVGHLRADL